MSSNVIDQDSAFGEAWWWLLAAHPGLRPHCIPLFPVPTPSPAIGMVGRAERGLLSLAGFLLPLDLRCALLSWHTQRQAWGDIYISHIDENYQDLKMPFRSTVARNMLHCNSCLKVSHVYKGCSQEESRTWYYAVIISFKNYYKQNSPHQNEFGLCDHSKLIKMTNLKKQQECLKLSTCSCASLI